MEVTSITPVIAMTCLVDNSVSSSDYLSQNIMMYILTYQARMIHEAK